MVNPTVRGTRRAALAAFLGVLLLLAPALPAHSWGTAPPPSPGPVSPGNGPAPWGEGRPLKVKSYNVAPGTGCSLVSTSSYLGGVCVSNQGRDPISIKGLLKGDPLPDCWDVRLTREELDAMNLENSAGYGWWWHRCLHGIDPDTLEITAPEGVTFSMGIWVFAADPQPGEEYVPYELTVNQANLVEHFESRGNVPPPVLLASPNPVPRVNDPVSFYNSGEDQMQVTVFGDVQMRASVEEIVVYPEGPDGPTVRCDGSGHQADPDDREGSGAGCWYRYPQASSTQPDGYYTAEIHARWVVETNASGQWERFHQFTKSGTALIQVNEVQALVVP